MAAPAPVDCLVHGEQLIYGNRTPKQVTLSSPNAKVHERIELLVRLDPFSDYLDVVTSREIADRSNQIVSTRLTESLNQTEV